MGAQRGEHGLCFVGMVEEADAASEGQRGDCGVLLAMQFPCGEQDEFKCQQGKQAAGQAGGIVQGEMPPIFVLGSDGEPQIVNSRIHQNILIVDRLFGAAELRLGSGNRQQTVRIVRIEQRQAAQPANTGESPS